MCFGRLTMSGGQVKVGDISVFNVETFRRGLKLCLSNHDLWVKEAKELYDKGSYGHAYVLLFNAIEALVQSYFCWLVLIGAKKPDDKEFIKVFYEHDIKLDVILEFILTSVDYKKYLENKYGLVWTKEYSERDLKRDIKRLQDAKGRFRKEKLDLRKHGTYVVYDDKNKIFFSPEDIEREKVATFLGEASIAHNVIKHLICNTSQEIVDLLREESKHLE